MGSPRPPRLTKDECEHIFRAALAAGDAESVAAALHIMATLDPQRAQVLLDTVKVGLAIARDRPQPGGTDA